MTTKRRSDKRCEYCEIGYKHKPGDGDPLYCSPDCKLEHIKERTRIFNALCDQGFEIKEVSNLFEHENGVIVALEEGEKYGVEMAVERATSRLATLRAQG